MGTKWAKRLISDGIGSSSYRAQPLSAKIAVAGVLLVPFQQAFTIDVGAPLKISELLFAVAIIFYCHELLGARSQRSKSRRWIKSDLLVLGIALSLIISTSVAVFTSGSITAIPGAARSPLMDMALYFAYGSFALAIWFTLRSIPFQVSLTTLMQSAWLCAIAVLAQILSRYIPGLTTVLKHMGFSMDRWGITVEGETFLRNGPFLEGQHLGFYAGGIIVLALFSKMYVTAAIAIACAMYSMSTTAFVAVAIALLVTVLAKPSRALLTVAASFVAIGAALIAVILPLRNAFLFQLSKLNLFGLGSPSRTTSLDVRSAKTEIGWRMMWDYPFGVGPGRFGVFFHDYVNEYDGFSTYIRSGKGRAIAENVYSQVGGELGILGLLSLIALLTTLLITTWRLHRAAFSLVVFVTVGVTTQSSWTFLPIWVFMTAAASITFSAAAKTGHSNLRDSPRRTYRAQNNLSNV